jgi:hypothetical protein
LVREGFTGGGAVVGTEPTVGAGGIGEAVSVAVAEGVKVGIGVMEGIGDAVKVGNSVAASPEGWKGVAVGEALGSCVTRIKVGKTGGGAEAGEAQAATRIRSKK